MKKEETDHPYSTVLDNVIFALIEKLNGIGVLPSSSHVHPFPWDFR